MVCCTLAFCRNSAFSKPWQLHLACNRATYLEAWNLFQSNVHVWLGKFPTFRSIYHSAQELQPETLYSVLCQEKPPILNANWFHYIETYSEFWKILLRNSDWSSIPLLEMLGQDRPLLRLAQPVVSTPWSWKRCQSSGFSQTHRLHGNLAWIPTSVPTAELWPTVMQGPYTHKDSQDSPKKCLPTFFPKLS